MYTGDPGAKNLFERQLDLNGASIHDFRLYQSLAKYTPKAIADWIHSEGGIVGQENAVNAVASVLYSHWHFPLRPKRNLLLIGSTGCGKSELMRSVQKFFLANLGDIFGTRTVRTIDATQLNASGWRGGIKLSDVLRDVPQPYGCFVILDEADKMVEEHYAGGASGSWSVSHLVQEQLLTALDHQTITLTDEASHTFVCDTQRTTWILLGAFTDIREKKAKKRECRQIGFSDSATDAATNISDEITTEDLCDYGMMPEIAGRLCPIMMDDVTPDMMFRIAQKELKTLCTTTELNITVPDAKLRFLAEDAFRSGQGGRGILKRLQAELDKVIFDNPCHDMYIL